MHKFASAACFAALLGYSGGAMAADLGYGSVKDAPVARSSNFSVDVGLGVVSGEANEYVYNGDGSKLSQLIWKYDNNLVLKGGAEWTPSRIHWLALGVKGSINLNDSSTMDDWDWGVEDCPGGICHSHHEDTRLERKTEVDLHASATFVRQGNFTLAGLVGYKWDYSKWQAYGGTANYATLPAGLGITYEQWWETPYIGLQAKAEHGRWSFMGKIIGSWWADGHDEDNHHLRGLLFTEEFGSSDMIGATAQLGYNVQRGLSVTLTYEYQAYDLAKGSTTITDYEEGGTAVIPGDVAGGDNTTHTIMLGLDYKFGESEEPLK